MQQDTEFDDSRFRCEQHPSHSYKSIYYGQNCPHKRRFLCIECVIQAQDNKHIVSFQQFFQDPIALLDQNAEYDNFTKANVSGIIITIIDRIVTQSNLLHQKFIDQFIKLKEEFSNISNQIKEQLTQRIKIKEFLKQLKQVCNMDAYQGTEEFKILEKQLNDIIVNWKNISQEYIKETNNHLQKDQIIQDLKMKLIDYRQQYTLQQKQIFDDLPIQQLDLLWRDQEEIEPFVLNEISQRKQIKYDLLYQGTRDGLTVANYWQKCDQQSQILTIITLKNGNIFGGYSPCKLNQTLDGKFVVDDTNSSFIFQQNKQEIYKLKNKVSAIHCYKDYGPAFGFGHDFVVFNDFKSVSSNLGHSYDITGYYVQNIQTHLIGDKDTEIMECKVYEIKFL